MPNHVVHEVTDAECELFLHPFIPATNGAKLFLDCVHGVGRDENLFARRLDGFWIQIAIERGRAVPYLPNGAARVLETGPRGPAISNPAAATTTAPAAARTRRSTNRRTDAPREPRARMREAPMARNPPPRSTTSP